MSQKLQLTRTIYDFCLNLMYLHHFMFTIMLGRKYFCLNKLQISRMGGGSTTITITICHYHPEKNSQTRAKKGVFASNRVKHGTKKVRNRIKGTKNGAFLTKKNTKNRRYHLPHPFAKFFWPDLGGNLPP